MNKPLAALATALSIVTIVLAAEHQTFIWVDAGGPKLRMQIAGNGSPTVVFDTGGGGSLEGWGRVPSEVSKFAKAVSYDRAGNGLSDKSATPRDARHIATELHTALRNAKLEPPYILVGHSAGGPYVRVFAGMYPDEVAGMVLVDPTQEETFDWNQQNGFALSNRDQCTLDDEVSCEVPTLQQAHESPVPSKIPVFLIHVMYPWGPAPFPSKDRDEIARTYGSSRVPARFRFHKEWVERIPGAQLIVTENSSHGLMNLEEPELVVSTIRQALNKAKR
jgi:pimeloyl-ACP methyl ester carboxylesterase